MSVDLKARLNHVEEILGKVQEHQRSAFDQLQVDDVVGRELAYFALFSQVASPLLRV